ncbi:uncharacterized protein LOC127729516 [Mytilus californianus]|uniref:uncharacterized protein LOC127729516 n=1 Tax=Mytilus californianus TaxID=6549 RepID=UPI00224600EC|nr:uncharacterized protein LOC127729516 [Mytilus californianus]
MIFKLMSLCLLPFCNCLEEIPHACLNRTSGNYYCCSDFEEKDGKCVACETGFTSDNGEPCIQCSGIFFGDRCIYECNCQHNQKCHHIHGCIIEHSLKPTPTPTSLVLITTDIDTHEKETTTTRDIEYSQTYLTTTSPVQEVSCMVSTEQTPGFQLELLIYSASVTGFTLILIIYVCKKCTFRRKTSSVSMSLNDEVNPNDPPNERHETFELSEGLYHTINEDYILNISINDNPYLEAVDGSSDSDSIKNDNGEKVRYTPPNRRQITTTSDKHPYEKSRPVSFKSHDQISSIQENDQDYLTPKPTDNSPLTFEAEIFAMIHAETSSSTGSENDKNDKNDGIDYLNPYQPLEKCNQTEKDNGYDIPLPGPTK